MNNKNESKERKEIQRIKEKKGHVEEQDKRMREEKDKKKTGMEEKRREKWKNVKV